MLVTLDENAEAVKYLCGRDKRLAKVISMVGPISYEPYADSPYAFVVHEIIEQMLSIKAGAKIYGRLEELCGGEICPEKIHALTDEQIRSTGTSASKVRCIRGLTDAVMRGELDFGTLAAMPDEEVVNTLTKLKGIGMWTAKMYLIFVLDRQDVLPSTDAAFLQGYAWAYKTDDLSPKSVKAKCRKWKPYSSIAARYMYRALDMGLTKSEFHLYKK